MMHLLGQFGGGFADILRIGSAPESEDEDDGGGHEEDEEDDEHAGHVDEVQLIWVGLGLR